MPPSLNGRGFWKNFLTGLLVLFPAFVTLTIVQVMFGWFYHLMIQPTADLMALVFSREESSGLVRFIISICFVLGIAAVGWGTRLLMLRRFFGLGESVVRRVPIIGPVYGTMREISNTFSGQRRGLFNRVVLLEWPRPGVYSIGFVTSEGKGEVQEKTPEHVINVFVPTTPNPTSGFLVLVPREALINMDMSVEDGMRLVISGGVSGPPVKIPAQRGKG